MSGYRLSPLALDDLDAIDAYVSAHSPRAAKTLLNTLFKAFGRLAEQPGLGHTRTDLTALPVRFLTVAGRYTIVYREMPDRLDIVRIIGGGRDVSAILEG